MTAPHSGRFGAHLALAVALGSAPSAASMAEARSVVVRSTGPSAQQHRPGQVLPDPLFLRLDAGDVVTILDEQGTRELRGPVVIDEASQPTSPTPRKISWQSVLGAKLRARAAGTRGKDEAPPLMPAATKQSDLWAIDPQVAGNWCAIDLAGLTFWRAETGAPGAISLRSDDKGATVEWGAGQPTVGWPRDIVPQGGARYTLALADGQPRSLTLARVSPPTTLEALANELADNGCYHQLGILVGS